MTSSRRMILICAAALLGVALAMGWVTYQAIALDRAERQARADNQHQESIRLALWRMDSQLTAILAREAARPYFEFQPFYPAQRAYTRMFEPVQPGEVLVPSPLLNGGDDLVRLYFQLGPDGQLTSPQSPTGNMRDLAESTYVSSSLIIDAEQRLNRLNALGIATRLPDPRPRPQPQMARRGAAPGAGPLPHDHSRPQGDTRRSRDEADALDTVVAQAESPQTKSPAPQTAQTFEEYAARQRQADLSNQPQRTAPFPPVQITRIPVGDRDDKKATDKRKSIQEKQAAAEGGQPSILASGSNKVAEPADLLRPELKDVVPPLTNEDAYKRESSEYRAGPGLITSGAGTDDALTAISPLPPTTSLEQGPFHAVWVRPPLVKSPMPSPRDPELLLVRRVTVNDQELHQGLWMDWPVLRSRLLASAVDLLPSATVEPIAESDIPQRRPDEVGRLLATIPARLTPGPTPAIPNPLWTPRRATLLLSWLALLGAGTAVFMVLRASMALSERRGRFVSTVTHELRTPLTTFCMYSQMLADGMVTDEQARRDYLATLKSESRRLARVVEDVLDYARLSRPKPKTRHAPGPAPQLVAHCLPELHRRAERGGMTLLTELEALDHCSVAVDPRPVERILLNLVDNACKYATGPDRRLHLTARCDGSRLRIQIADHGPGIPALDAARVFEPFERGRSAEHQSEPGLGLGLSLSRGLAHELGGDLRVVTNPDYGAVFELSLPTSAPALSAT